MKTIQTALITLIVTSAPMALADGFTCESVDQNLDVKVYNHTNPEIGTRVAAVMVLSNPNVGTHKTIAKFEEVDGLLESDGAHYSAGVDLRYSNSNGKGELIGGTKLGQLDTILLDVDFNYAEPKPAGTEVAGLVTLVKRNGNRIELDMVCTRYLKN